MKTSVPGPAALAAIILCASCAAHADVTVGVVLSQTGPAASLGIPERNTLQVLPETLGGQKVKYVMLDDASDPTQAVKQGRRLIDEDKVDIIMGPSTTPTSLALLDAAGSGQTPMFSLAGSNTIVAPLEGNKRWAFKLAPSEAIMGEYVFESMKTRGEKTLAYISFASSFGDSFVTEMDKLAAKHGVKIVANERYNPADTSVAAQVLKVMSANPDAVFIAASGTPGGLPVIELRKRDYKGQIYTQQGIANPDFLRVVGKDGDNVIFPVSPVLVAEQLPESNASRKPAMEYVGRYEGKYGAGTRSLFGATLWDAYVMLDKAVPLALKAGQPGTQQFRTGLRDALEKVGEVAGSQGVFNLSPTDHNGTDKRAQVLVKIEGGKWVLVR